MLFLGRTQPKMSKISVTRKFFGRKNAHTDFFIRSLEKFLSIFDGKATEKKQANLRVQKKL